MREIKFRGISEETGKWIYGHYVKFDDLHFILPENSKLNGGFPEDKEVVVIPESIGQFTGFKDKNGKEIYEGDILFDKGILSGEVMFGEYKCKDQSNHDRQLSHVGWFVEHTHWANRIKGIDNYTTEFLSLEYLFWNLQSNYSVRKREDQNWVEIRGSKFKNPELLEARE